MIESDEHSRITIYMALKRFKLMPGMLNDDESTHSTLILILIDSCWVLFEIRLIYCIKLIFLLNLGRKKNFLLGFCVHKPPKLGI